MNAASYAGKAVLSKTLELEREWRLPRRLSCGSACEQSAEASQEHEHHTHEDQPNRGHHRHPLRSHEILQELLRLRIGICGLGAMDAIDHCLPKLVASAEKSDGDASYKDQHRESKEAGQRAQPETLLLAELKRIGLTAVKADRQHSRER